MNAAGKAFIMNAEVEEASKQINQISDKLLQDNSAVPTNIFILAALSSCVRCMKIDAQIIGTELTDIQAIDGLITMLTEVRAIEAAQLEESSKAIKH